MSVRRFVGLSLLPLPCRAQKSLPCSMKYVCNYGKQQKITLPTKLLVITKKNEKKKWWRPVFAAGWSAHGFCEKSYLYRLECFWWCIIYFALFAPIFRQLLFCPSRNLLYLRYISFSSVFCTDFFILCFLGHPVHHHRLTPSAKSEKRTDFLWAKKSE